MKLAAAMLIPLLMAAVALYAQLHRVDVYAALTEGAGKGLQTLRRIFPALVALLTAVHMLRASGALELAAGWCGPVLRLLGIPPETVGLVLLRPVSGSAALSVGSELMDTYGPDSYIGRVAAVRAAAGSQTPFDILPAVWLASSVSVCVGICMAKIGAVLWRERR